MHDQDHMRDARRRIAKMKSQTQIALRNARNTLGGSAGVARLESRLEELNKIDQEIVNQWTASTRAERFGGQAAQAMAKGGMPKKSKDADVMEILIMIGAAPKKKPASKKKK